MYDARQIANWFILRAREDGRKLSIMQLLKLVYIAHGWHLEMRGYPLFRNKIEAWRHGPVIPDVYHALRNQGVTVQNPAIGFSTEMFPQTYQGFLNEIYKIYGDMDAFHLSDLTHKPGGPWDIATKQRGWFAPITDDIIRAHYVHMREQSNQNVN